MLSLIPFCVSWPPQTPVRSPWTLHRPPSSSWHRPKQVRRMHRPQTHHCRCHWSRQPHLHLRLPHLQCLYQPQGVAIPEVSWVEALLFWGIWRRRGWQGKSFLRFTHRSWSLRCHQGSLLGLARLKGLSPSNHKEVSSIFVGRALFRLHRQCHLKPHKEYHCWTQSREEMKGAIDQ